MLARARSVLSGWLRRHGFPGDPEPVAAVLAAAIDGLVLHRAVDRRLNLAGLAGPLRALAAGAATDDHSGGSRV